MNEDEQDYDGLLGDDEVTFFDRVVAWFRDPNRVLICLAAFGALALTGGLAMALLPRLDATPLAPMVSESAVAPSPSPSASVTPTPSASATPTPTPSAVATATPEPVETAEPEDDGSSEWGNEYAPEPEGGSSPGDSSLDDGTCESGGAGGSGGSGCSGGGDGAGGATSDPGNPGAVQPSEPAPDPGDPNPPVDPAPDPDPDPDPGKPGGGENPPPGSTGPVN